METQKVLRRKQNRQVRFGHIPIEGDVCILKNALKGWLRLREYVGKVQGIKRFLFFSDNSDIMVIDDRDGFPVSPYRPSKEQLAKNFTINGDWEIADRQADYHNAQSAAEERQYWYTTSLTTAILGIVFMTILIFALTYFGKINIGLPR